MKLAPFLSVTCMLIAFVAQDLNAQIPGPGAERDMKRIKELEKGSVLRQDSVALSDTIVVFDPENYEETMTVVNSKYSLYDYCQQILGISNPDVLLDGQPVEITDPVTYETMMIRFNPERVKIDTVQN